MTEKIKSVNDSLKKVNQDIDSVAIPSVDDDATDSDEEAEDEDEDSADEVEPVAKPSKPVKTHRKHSHKMDSSEMDDLSKLVKEELSDEPHQLASKNSPKDKITEEVREIVHTQVKKEIENRVREEVRAKVHDVLAELRQPGLAKIIAEANEGIYDSDEAEEQAAEAHLEEVKEKIVMKAKARQVEEEYEEA